MFLWLKILSSSEVLSHTSWLCMAWFATIPDQPLPPPVQAPPLPGLVEELVASSCTSSTTATAASDTRAERARKCQAECSEVDVDDDPVPTEGSVFRRHRKHLFHARMLKSFKSHKFTDVNEPLLARHFFPRPSFLFEKEVLYPLHMAVKEGNIELLVLLLRCGADRDQRTSKGRSILEIAQKGKCSKTREKIIQILQEPKKLSCF